MYEIRLPEPHEKQKLFQLSTAKRKIIRAGRRAGKTIGSGIMAVEGFLGNDKLNLLPKRILYGAPTQEQVDRFWHVCCNALAAPIEAGIFYKNETKHIIERLGTEQRIRGKTCWSADTLRGDYADLLILDEYQLMNEDAWALVGAPMLLDNNGDAIFIYTPPSYRTRSISKAYDLQHAAKLFKKARQDTTGRWATFHFTSYDNPYISAEALDEIALDMTSLAHKQEILAEDVEDVPGALWIQRMIDETRISEAPELKRIVVGVDPQGKKKDSSETGIVVAGIGYDNQGYILADESLNARPEQWGFQVVKAYEQWRGDRIIAESNFGGDMVISVIQNVKQDAPVRLVNASRGKIVRAEPISALYEQKKVHHVGSFPRLEDEMCMYTPDSVWSPNRMDAMVWALTELMPKSGGGGFTVELGDERDMLA